VMKRILGNERGAVLVAAIMMLAVLMIIGLAATSTTTIELQISGNDKAATQIFYEAESAAYEGAGLLKELNFEQGGNLAAFPFIEVSTADRQTDLSSFRSSQEAELDSGIRDPATWIAEGETGENSTSGALDNTSYRIMALGADETSSLTLNSSLGKIRHKAAIVGRYESTTGGRRGNAMVEIGVRY
jgi:hypothetical protein